MRIAALATSAVLLSGCSWLGLGQNSSDSWNDYNRGAQASGRYHSAHQPQQRGYAPQQSGYAGQYGNGPCEITSVTQPVPQGCSAEQVTIALPGGQYGGAYAGGQNQSYGAQAPATGSYGRSLHDINRAQAAANQGLHKAWQRPRFRLNAMTGFEKSVSGPSLGSGSASLYDPSLHSESSNVGTQAAGQTTDTVYTVVGGGNQGSDISISDIYSAPFTLGGGAEYQLNDKMAIFGNASYSMAEGGNIPLTSYVGGVNQEVTIQNWIATATPGVYAADGTPSINDTIIPDVTVARVDGTVNDMQRTNLEVGGRYYFKDAFPQYIERPVTPYVSAAAGASHYNALEMGGSSEQLLLTDYFADPSTPAFSSGSSATAVEVLEAGWVPTGAISVGAEWQITPKAALALETGIRYEGGRTLTAGGETDDNIAIPLTLRGSIGF